MRLRNSSPRPDTTRKVRMLIESALVIAVLFASPGTPVPGEEAAARSETLDLTKAVVLAPDETSGPEAKAVAMLIEEVHRLSGLRWQIAKTWPADAVVIAVGRE